MPNQCIQDLFEARVEQSPQAPAVTFEGAQLTYQELNGRANQLAHHLRRIGVSRDVPVGLCMKRSLEMITSVLGILKAGGAYVPLDPMHPPDHLAFMLQDTQAPVLLTQRSLLGHLPRHQAAVLCLDADWQALVGEPLENLHCQASADSLAYIIYTSGSTGRPKGVMVPHRGLVNYLTWCASAYATGSGTGAPVQSSLTFDLTITSLFTPLLAGTTVHLLPDGKALDPLREAFHIAKDFSLIKITPAHLELLGQELDRGEAPGRTRAFIIGGENLTSRHIAFWQEYAPETVLVNEYGPTETVVGCCVYRVPAGKHRSGSIPIGRPIANTQLHVLDAHMRPVVPGHPGELYIGGAGVARGYLNRPDLTAALFLPDPFTHKPGARLYRTGDLVRLLPDGNLESLGRIDRQVKIRGFRVELEEIELALAQHPSIRKAAVLACENVPGQRRLVAYVVPRPGSSLTAASMRRYLAARLPAYMVPAFFRFLDDLPLSYNGKVDYKALPALAHAPLEQAETLVAPNSALEARLVHLWEEVLGIRPIGVSDNFFDLGGDSLFAAVLCARIVKLFGSDLTPASLLELPTVEQLARLLDAPHEPADWASLVPLQRSGWRPPFFCVHAIGGEVLGFSDLARHLGPDQPCYGLQSRGLNAKHSRPNSLELMAAQYLEEVRAVQPEGPYYLGGFSFGGTIAFEMARQLHAQGQTVGLLAVLDQRSRPDGCASRFTPRSLLEFVKNLPFWVWHDLLESSPRTMLNRLRLKARAALGPAVSKAARTAGATFDLGCLPPQYRDLLEYHFRVLFEYVPRSYPGRVTLLRARAQPLSRPGTHDLGWGSLAQGGVDVIGVPGSHDTILKEPYVGMLGGRLRACLAKAQAALGPAGPSPAALGVSPKPPTRLTQILPACEVEDLVWTVVINHEGQYAIWPADRPAAPGWIVVNHRGAKDHCLAFIKEVWTDQRPLSLQQMDRDSSDHAPTQELPPPKLPGPHRINAEGAVLRR